MNNSHWEKPIVIIIAIVMLPVLWNVIVLYSSANHMQKPDDEHRMMIDTVASEKGFLQDMIPHLDDATKAESLILTSGSASQDLKALAEKMASENTDEMTNMQNWYYSWYGEVYKDAGAHEHMIRTDLDSLSDSELIKAFVSDSIENTQHEIDLIVLLKKIDAHSELKDLSLKMTNKLWSEMDTLQSFQKELSK